MTLQEVYNTVVKHLLDQGGPALDAAGECLYRAADGRKCAIGVLIPDNQYDEAIEGQSFTHALRICELALPVELHPLLANLQMAHDTAKGPWPEHSENRAQLFYHLSGIRAKYGLQPLGPETEC